MMRVSYVVRGGSAPCSRKFRSRSVASGRKSNTRATRCCAVLTDIGLVPAASRVPLRSSRDTASCRCNLERKTPVLIQVARSSTRCFSTAKAFSCPKNLENFKALDIYALASFGNYFSSKVWEICEEDNIRGSINYSHMPAIHSQSVAATDSTIKGEMFRPPVNRAMRSLDRAFFQKRIPICAARVMDNKMISRYRLELQRSQDMLKLDRIATVRPDPVPENSGGKCLLLKPGIQQQGGLLTEGCQ